MKGGRYMATMEERLRKIIADQLGVEEEKVVPSATFAGDLDADSLDLVELMMSLEDEFGVEIPDEDAEKLESVGDAIRYLNEKSAA